MNEVVVIAVTLVAAERLIELRYAARNTAALLAEGAVEYGKSHYPLIVALHTLWLAAILLFAPRNAAVSWPLLALFGALQLVRVWILLSLGRFWTTRIISLPGAKLVRRGPYRFVRHPNYLLVAAEIAILPSALGAWQVAMVFSLLNAGLLAWRIHVENQSLAARR